MRGSDLAERTQQFACPIEILWKEKRVAPPDVVGRQVVLVVPAGEEPLRERAVGNDDAVVLSGPGHELVAITSQRKAELHLVGQHPGTERSIRLLPLRKGEVAH